MKDNIIVNSICDYIKDKILSKEMFPGYRIVEDELANELGVSRTPLRRALAQLQYEGFLYIIPNRGTFVVQSTYEDIVQVYEARAYIEEGLARGIINSVSDKDIADLEAINNKLEELVNNHPIVDYSMLNREFHVRLASISSNEYLKKYVEEIHNRILIFFVYYDDSLNSADSIETHKKIIEGLRRKDYDLLVKGIREDAALGNIDKIRNKPSLFFGNNSSL